MTKATIAVDCPMLSAYVRILSAESINGMSDDLPLRINADHCPMFCSCRCASECEDCSHPRKILNLIGMRIEYCRDGAVHMRHVYDDDLKVVTDGGSIQREYEDGYVQIESAKELIDIVLRRLKENFCRAAVRRQPGVQRMRRLWLPPPSSSSPASSAPGGSS